MKAELDDYPTLSCKNVEGNPIQLNHLKFPDLVMNSFTHSTKINKVETNEVY